LFRFSIGVALPDVAGEFRLDSVQAGLLISVTLASATATIALAGYLSDRVGEKLVMTMGLATYGTGLLGILLVHRYDLFMALLVVNGLGSGLMIPPTYSVVGRLAPRSRGLAIGALGGSYNGGGLIGPVVTSALLTTAGWRTPFALMGASAVVAATLVFFFLRAPPRLKQSSGDSEKRGSKLGILRERNITIIGAGMFLADLAFLSFVSWTPTFMRQGLSMPTEQAGFFFGLAIAIGAIGVMSAGYLFDKIGGKRTVIIAGCSASALTFLFFIHPGGFPLALVFLILAGLVANTHWTLLSTLAQVSVDESHIGTATGMIQNIGFLGAMMGPSIVGYVVARLDFSFALVIVVSLLQAKA
jgi:MFS family permease